MELDVMRPWRRSRWRFPTVMLAALAFSIMLFALNAVASPSGQAGGTGLPKETAAPDSPSPRASSVIDALGARGGSADRLPISIEESLMQGVPRTVHPAHSRLLLTQGSAKVFAFPGALGEDVCTVFLEDLRDDYYAAATCADASTVAEHGLPLVVQRGEAVDAIVLLPDVVAGGRVAADNKRELIAERAIVHGNVLRLDLTDRSPAEPVASGLSLQVSKGTRSIDVEVPMGEPQERHGPSDAHS